MDELCTTCHTTGRKLFFISETKFEHLYSQIINEISLNKMSGLRVRICWECKALLRRMYEFKEQAKRCYSELVQYVEQKTTKPFPICPRLQIHQIVNFSYPLTIKQEEEEEFGETLVMDTAATDDDVGMNDEPFNSEPFNSGPFNREPFNSGPFNSEPFNSEPLNSGPFNSEPFNSEPFNDDDGFDVKSEDTHCEPETFVRNWKSEERNRETVIKKNKHIKQKSKKKPKLKNEKELKRKVKKKDSEVNKTPHTVKRTIESLIDSTVVECYSQEGDKTKTDRNQKIVENERDEEGNGDSGDNVNILVYTTPNYNVNKVKKPVVVKEVLSERPTCAECGKTFSSRKTYKYHLNVLHKGQNRHPCPRCGKVYQWKSNLGRHIRSHKARDSDELYCEKCDKRFASVATYRQHLRISRRHVSESEFSFTCSDCGKKFVNKTRLRDHIDWEHLKKIKFTCQKCNKAFKCHTSLYVHMQNVHCAKDQKLNLCHVCGKSYQNAAKLKYHIVAMHTSETPYQCTQCNAAFGWYSSLYRHVKEVHYKIKHPPKKTKKQKKPEVPAQLMVRPTQPHT